MYFAKELVIFAFMKLRAEYFAQTKQAFSLVELSIVLVILGLLVGGVLSGQSLIRAAEIRSVSTDYSKYLAATYSFRDKYFALPGDMTNATSFWGVAAGTAGNDATCYNAVGAGTATCNGDGDGFISASGMSEYYLFWKHLANAGLIEGSYLGTDATNAGYAIADVKSVNLPPCRIDSFSAWQAFYNPVLAGTTTAFAFPAGNLFRFSNPSGTGAPLNPQEAWNIDTKVDDGFPGKGKIMSNKGSASTFCTTAGGVAPPGDDNAAYNLSYSSKACRLFMYF